MSSGTGSPYQRAMMSSDRRQLGAATLLAWVAGSDGAMTQRQQQVWQDTLAVRQKSGFGELALTAVRDAALDDLLLACEAVRNMASDARREFLQRAFSVATAEQRLSIAANYTLRFLADLVGVDLSELSQQVGKGVPAPGDPSSIDWWKLRERAAAEQARKSSAQGGAGQKKSSGKKSSSGRLTRAEALEILGLDGEASTEEIARTFRRLAHRHHPDRFSQASEESQRLAAKQFARLRAAFEVLTKG